MNLFWHKSDNYPNFGDELSPWIIAQLSGEQPRHVPIPLLDRSAFTSLKAVVKYFLSHKCSFSKLANSNEWREFRRQPVVLSIGSILSFHKYPNTIVWGSGIISKDAAIVNAEFRAVRGYHTIKRIQELGYKAPHIVGDPALLLNLMYQPKVQKQYKLGIIPHVFQFATILDQYQDAEIVVIDLKKPILEVLDIINSCEMTISTSLHGLIVSHTFNIPSLWVQFNNLGLKELNGDDIKFADYFSSVQLPEYKAVAINNRDTLAAVHDFCNNITQQYTLYLLPQQGIIQQIQANLLSVAPFKILDKYKHK